MTNPLVLVPLVAGRPLILYILATLVALGALLAQLDDNGNEQAIYYLSWTLVGYELNYTTIEKACLAVVFCTQKLHHYMLNHTTYLIAKIDPLKYLLSRAALTGRAAKWVLILSEFDIVYKDYKAIKGQVIADQLVEASFQGDHPIRADFPYDTIMTIAPSTLWKLFFDGSFT